MWSEILDALKDSAIAVPFLLAIYLLIEFLESNKRAKERTVRLLNGKFAPLVAGGVGLIPQCGFSVMATDLYCQNYLKTGTLIAFFVATSDEALPILLTNSKTVGIVWVVLLIKIVFAVALGYFINLFDRRLLATQYTLTETGCCHHELSDDENCEVHTDEADEHTHGADGCAEETTQYDVSSNAAQNTPANVNQNTPAQDNANRSSSKQRWHKIWHFVKHPIFHTLKIFAYIFVVNAIFGVLLFYTEDAIMNFTADLGFFQGFLTAAIGLIPNCASSVIITGMYSEGIIGLSAMIAGLVSNSGIALAILFKQRKWKRNFGILGIMYLAGVVISIACYFLFPITPLGTH